MAERELKTLTDAVLLLDEWRIAHYALGATHIREHHALCKKLDAAELENHRLYAQLCDYWLLEATAAAANAEDEPEGCPF